MTRPTFDETFLAMAEVLSKRAACTRRQVGAVITKHNKVISCGYNGVPSGALHCTDGGCLRGKFGYEELPADAPYSNCSAVHAEANALLQAGYSSYNATIYITDKPCHECERLIRAANIARIVTPMIGVNNG